MGLLPPWTGEGIPGGEHMLIDSPDGAEDTLFVEFAR